MQHLPNLPRHSQPLFMFTLQGRDQASLADLVRCNSCKLTVHKVCYGGPSVRGIPEYWLCERCRTKSEKIVSV